MPFLCPCWFVPVRCRSSPLQGMQIAVLRINTVQATFNISSVLMGLDPSLGVQVPRFDHFKRVDMQRRRPHEGRAVAGKKKKKGKSRKRDGGGQGDAAAAEA